MGNMLSESVPGGEREEEAFIEFVQRPGSAPGTVSPLVDFSVGWIRGFRGKALIDTGADSLIVDEEVLVNTGCPKLTEVSLIKTVHAQIEHAHYMARLTFDEAETSSEIDVVGMSLSGRAYQAIFGTRLLELGRLVLDRESDSYFQFYDHSLADPDQE